MTGSSDKSLLLTDGVKLEFEKLDGGKFAVKGSSIEDSKAVVMPGQVLEVRFLDGKIKFTRVQGEAMSHHPILDAIQALRNEFARAHPAVPSFETLTDGMARIEHEIVKAYKKPEDAAAPAEPVPLSVAAQIQAEAAPPTTSVTSVGAVAAASAPALVSVPETVLSAAAGESAQNSNPEPVTAIDNAAGIQAN